jgi:tetraprenyl-beta-curcumene synthase
MAPSPAGSRLAATFELSRVAPLYWLCVFPLVRREQRLWSRRAARIPDHALRELALRTIAEERGNAEGAGAFATQTGHEHRHEAVRALSAFQLIYDYVDTLAEQPATDAVSNGLRLHLALCSALDSRAAHPDYYAHHPNRCDGGYLRELVERCRASIAALPSRQAVSAPALLAVRRMRIFQSLNHSTRVEARAVLASWAARQTTARCGLRWWESAAATASSVTVFALIAAGSHRGLPASAAWEIHRAYFPWVGALHVLLDSLLDHEEDLATGRHSLLGHYRSPQEAAQRIGAIAVQAARSVQALPGGMRHSAILTAMASFYLSACSPDSPHARHVRPQVLAAMGALAGPTMSIMRVRRRTAQLRPSAWVERGRT